MNTFIYSLKCEGDKYYVGRTENPQKRIDEHIMGKGSAWTQKYAPIEWRCIPATRFDEDSHVIMLMDEHGIDNVRGGSYSTIELSPEMRSEIDRKLCTVHDLCYKCHKKGHFSKNCRQKDSSVVESFTISDTWQKINRSSKISNPPKARGKKNEKKCPTGYCIRCKGMIVRNQYKPYCLDCYDVWLDYGNPDYIDKCCHYCGRDNDSTLNKPLCKPCWSRK